MPVYALECFHFVVKLEENGLRRHFPVHAERIWICQVFIGDLQSHLTQESLSIIPDSPGGVQRLKLDANEVLHLAFVNRSQEVVH